VILAANLKFRLKDQGYTVEQIANMTLGRQDRQLLLTDHRYAQNYRLLRSWSTLQHFGPRLPTLVAGSRSCNRLASNMQLEEPATRGRKYLVVSRPLMDGHPGRTTIARHLGASRSVESDEKVLGGGSCLHPRQGCMPSSEGQSGRPDPTSQVYAGDVRERPRNRPGAAHRRAKQCA